jgi:ectoine hydroxylase-related dioxygenase (phytanoyl-CoA dioxygenase family)
MSQSDIGRQGFAFWRSALSSATVVDLIGAIEAAGASGGVNGLRNLLRRSPRVREIAAMLSSLVEPTLGAGAFPTRALLFDKLPHANWLVGWHQDLTIAVRERFESEGFRAWTIKDGVPHVQPPVGVLQNMLTLRLHLDRADAENGALIVLPGTHAMGRLPDDWAVPADAANRAVVCEAEAGDILAFRPLLLHMSRKSARPSHRRVIQIEYAASPLPPPLAWHESTDT